jgi:hypothetical protein
VLASKLLRAFLLISLAALASPHAAAQSKSDTEKLLPEKIGAVTAARGGMNTCGPGAWPSYRPEDFAVTAKDERFYNAGGESHSRTIFYAREIKTKSSTAALSLFAHLKDDKGASRFSIVDGLGVFGVAEGGHVKFVKGDAYVEAQDVSACGKNSEQFSAFVKGLVDSLPGESGFIPVPALHLPDWDKKLREGVGYAVSLPALQEQTGARPALDAVSFDEGTEAVTAKYGDARLVLVEFPTPQHAFDADAAINRRIAELNNAGQPVPSSYKRVGNYSVFVFDAPDTASAEKLVSGVKYEKDVRWLGRNPHGDEIAIRAYTNKMGGVILTTLITTGLAILVCLTIGGVIGGAIFLSRRAKHAAQEIYSDAGGMLRLNIEDLNTPSRTTKMLGRRED